MTMRFSATADAPRLDRVRSVIRSAIGQRRAGATPGRNRILVVDDDPQVLSLLGRMIHRMGFEAITANSVQAVDKGAISGLALMLVDLHIGGDHALSLIEQLALAGTGIPIVLMSGYGNRVLGAVRDVCNEQNCTVAGILSKPFEMTALESILSHFRRRKIAELYDALGDAIANGEVAPFYQPMVEMRTGKLSGAEALVRWLHPDQGIMMPADVLPEAEERGLMPALTFCMLNQALRDWRYLANGSEGFDISVNVTPGVIARSDFVPRVIALLADHGVAPRRLTLELTESHASLDVPQICTALCRLRSAGVNLALDDFGTGYSSLVALRDLPFNKIKLDRSFVTKAESRPEERMIMASVTRLARDFGLESIAEGIETQGCYDLARQFGMDYGQGNLLAEPLPCSEFRNRTAMRP